MSAPNRFRVVWLAELAMWDEQRTNGVVWCRGCDEYHSHRRGFATRGVVHLDSPITTRAALHRALHELGHVVEEHDRVRIRRFEKEAAAEKFAADRMRANGIPVPRKVAAEGRDYVAWMKRHGEKSVAGRRRQ